MIQTDDLQSVNNDFMTRLYSDTSPTGLSEIFSTKTPADSPEHIPSETQRNHYKNDEEFLGTNIKKRKKQVTSKNHDTFSNENMISQDDIDQFLNFEKEGSEAPSDFMDQNASFEEFTFPSQRNVHEEEKDPLGLKDKASAAMKKNEKFKKPVMERADEELLLELGPKYKNDWKKISKRIFNLRNRRFNTKFLMSRYKELVTDSAVKRVRFTHEEDLLIAKYFKKYGNDWNRIGVHFSSRTPTMLKNRYYSHIRKRKLLNELLSEADDESYKELLDEVEEEPFFESEGEDNNNLDDGLEEEKAGIDLEVLHLFSQKNQKLKCKKIKIPLSRLMFEINEFVLEEELCVKVTPLPN